MERLHYKATDTNAAFPKYRVMRKTAFAAIGLAVLLVTNGCTFVHNAYENMRYDETWNRAVISTRSKAWSKTAWHKRKHLFCRERQLDAFCDGFRAGYQEVCSGMNTNGCTPNVPPREYWSWQYQSAEGQQKTSAWFAGYPQGARAAEEDGVANWSQIQLSSNLQNQYRTAGVLPASQHSTYPIAPGPPVQIGGPTPAQKTSRIPNTPSDDSVSSASFGTKQPTLSLDNPN